MTQADASTSSHTSRATIRATSSCSNKRSDTPACSWSRPPIGRLSCLTVILILMAQMGESGATPRNARPQKRFRTLRERFDIGLLQNGTDDETGIRAIAGCPRTDDDDEIGSTCVANPTEVQVAAVRCCTDDEDDDDKCLSYCPEDGPGTEPTESLFANFSYAEEFCASQNRRLCRRGELNDCCGTGCGHDGRAVWTSNQCDDPITRTAPIGDAGDSGSSSGGNSDDDGGSGNLVLEGVVGFVVTVILVGAGLWCCWSFCCKDGRRSGGYGY